MISKEILSFILYPIKDSSINESKIYQIFDILDKIFNELKIEVLTDAIHTETTKEDLKEISDKINVNEKMKMYSLSRQLVNLFDFSKNQLEKLAVIGKLLNIKVNDLGFSFNIYDKDEINMFEFKKTVSNFSLVAGAIGFIPFIPISDFTILTLINTGMVTKIASIYDYKLDSKEFLKMISGVLGTGFLFRTMAKILYKLIPFIGWFINASIAYGGTYATGILAKAYIAENGELSREAIISIWERSLEDGKKEFFTLKDFIFDKKEELLKEINKFKDNQNEKKGNIAAETKKSKLKSNKIPKTNI